MSSTALTPLDPQNYTDLTWQLNNCFPQQVGCVMNVTWLENYDICIGAESHIVGNRTCVRDGIGLCQGGNITNVAQNLNGSHQDAALMCRMQVTSAAPAVNLRTTALSLVLLPLVASIFY